MLTPNHSPDNTCRLLPGKTGLLIQFVLGSLVFSSLLIKRRFFTHVQRPMAVWILDVVKQGFGQVCVHLFSLELGLYMFAMDHSLSQCAWYMVGFINDFVIGSALSYALLRLVEIQAAKPSCGESCSALKISGYYGPDQNNPSLLIWSRQTLCWCIIVMLSRMSSAIIMFWQANLFVVFSRIATLYLNSGP